MSSTTQRQYIFLTTLNATLIFERLDEDSITTSELNLVSACSVETDLIGGRPARDRPDGGTACNIETDLMGGRPAI